MTVAEPVPAATVVLARAAPDGFEVFLVKRHGKSGFMAGAHVFPGGKVDAADLAVDVGETADHGVDGALDARCYVAAAVRETFEECGVRLRPGDLVPYAWWVTPEAEPRRFDTRFFLAALPADQIAAADGHEVSEGEWLTPAAAVSAYAEGRVVLAPPTLVTLEDLATCATFDEARRSVGPLRRVCPVLHVGPSTAGVLDGAGAVIAFPGDALHPDPTPVWPHRTRLVLAAERRFVSASVPVSARPGEPGARRPTEPL
jgi:8-oxo-dGTP pyrophosphatase MutT (NUDIX family)